MDKLRQDVKAQEASRAELQIILDSEKAAADSRRRDAEQDATALREERAKVQRLEDDHKVSENPR